MCSGFKSTECTKNYLYFKMKKLKPQKGEWFAPDQLRKSWDSYQQSAFKGCLQQDVLRGRGRRIARLRHSITLSQNPEQTIEAPLYRSKEWNALKLLAAKAGVLHTEVCSGSCAEGGHTQSGLWRCDVLVLSVSNLKMPLKGLHFTKCWGHCKWSSHFQNIRKESN